MRVNTKRIQRERIRRGWSRSEVARRIGSSPPAITRIEQGRTTPPKVLKAIAELLDIPIEELIEFEDEAPHAPEQAPQPVISIDSES
ncbi:MAG: XRE family transcriptional regulator [Gaiellales bacterium]|nr:MAG: XRE family transcriptional regulator [Gaiellales bacterium]